MKRYTRYTLERIVDVVFTAAAIAAVVAAAGYGIWLAYSAVEARAEWEEGTSGIVWGEVAEPDNPVTIEPLSVEPWVAYETERADEAQEMRYLGEYQIYGYDTCPACCGKSDGVTASGTTATVGRTVACNSLPFGTRIYIEGIGERVVEDRGYLAPGVIDVLCDDHAACYAITGTYTVYIIEEGQA